MSSGAILVRCSQSLSHLTIATSFLDPRTGHTADVFSVAVSPDNRHVVSGSYDKTVQIWNLSTGEEEHLFPGHSEWVTTVAVSPDNRHIVSGSLDSTVRIWNLSTVEEEHVLGEYNASSIAVSTDNRHVVSGSFDKTVQIWNSSTGEEEHVLWHSDLVLSVAVSPDDRYVESGSSDKTIRVWNLTGDEEHALRDGMLIMCSRSLSRPTIATSYLDPRTRPF